MAFCIPLVRILLLLSFSFLTRNPGDVPSLQ